HRPSDPREQDEESDVIRLFHGGQWSVHAAFAMANEADSFGVDFLSRFQPFDRCERVLHKVGVNRLVEIARGFTHSAIIVAQHGDALTSEMIGYDQKRPVAHDGLVTILRTGACNQYD